VLFVGRFDEPRKGFGVLLDAWADVRHARPDARLLVVGRGDAEAAEQRVEERGLRDVHFVGPVDDATLARYYTTADVFCAPSTGQESFGIVLVEAMSSGTPIVASDIGGYRQVLHHRQEGVLVQPQQPSALAAAVLHLLDDPVLRACLGQSGRETAQHYAWTDVTHRLLDVYDRARTLHQIEEVPKLVLPASTVPLVTAASMPSGGAQTAPVNTLSSRETVENPHSTRGEDPMLPKSLEERVRALTQRVAGHLFGGLGISPNTITAIGLLLTLSVTVTLWTGHLIWGGILVLLTSAFDMLDGALARATDQKSAFGAFFDSTVDRYSEALILLGVLLYYESLPGVRWEVPLVYITIVGSLMVSYTRARAEALGFDGKTGILARPERIILLSFGLLVGWLPFALIILALFTNFTAAQRVYYVWAQERRNNPRPSVQKVPRRGRLASRDQRSS
jgi:CDP-diacylglycerol---glycerol-3-phosphate 3-phosphatidyltransferase